MFNPFSVLDRFCCIWVSIWRRFYSYWVIRKGKLGHTDNTAAVYKRRLLFNTKNDGNVLSRKQRPADAWRELIRVFCGYRQGPLDATRSLAHELTRIKSTSSWGGALGFRRIIRLVVLLALIAAVFITSPY